MMHFLAFVWFLGSQSHHHSSLATGDGALVGGRALCQPYAVTQVCPTEKCIHRSSEHNDEHCLSNDRKGKNQFILG